MKTLHFASVFENKASGLSFSVPNLIASQNIGKISCQAFLYNTVNPVKISSKELNRYDVIVFHSFFIVSYLQLLIKFPKRKKLVICPRGAFSLSNRYSLKKHLYSALYFGLINTKKIDYRIHFLTENEKKRSRFHSKNDFVIGNSIDLKNIKMDDNILMEKFKNRRIVYIGRFSIHIKGLDLLSNFIIENKDDIEAYNLEFHFYGPSSSEKNELKSMFIENNLKCVHFHGPIFGREKEEVLSSASFHILNSRSEGFPMSVLEAAKFFTPQLLSTGTNIEQTMVDENFGFSVNKEMFNKINNLSFEEYKTLAMNARGFAERHSFKNIGDQTNKEYCK